jgi:endonuclease-3
MVAPQRTKVSDKQDLCKKLLTLLKKRYPAPARSPELPVLETILFGICLENATFEQAQTAYQGLFKSFHDLNEARVSSMDELEAVFKNMRDADWRALRIRSVLQYVFETNYSFDFDSLKRKTLELAVKQLGKIKPLSPFVRSYTLQQSLGAHLLPIDDRMHAALVWLDLGTAGGTAEQTAEGLRGAVRKADGEEFCGLIRALATDPKCEPAFQQPDPGEGDETLPAPAVRLEQLLKGEYHPPRPKKPVAKKPAASQPAEPEVAKKAARKKPADPPPKAAKGKANNHKSSVPLDDGKAGKKDKKAAARSSR